MGDILRHARRVHGGLLRMATLLLALAAPACSGDGDTPIPGNATPGPSDRSDTALDASCTNDVGGYTVRYPAGWLVNTGDGLPPCSVFDPRNVDIPVDSEMPTAIAVSMSLQDVSFRQATDFAADPSVDVLDATDAEVDGRPALRAELRHTGWGLYDAGQRSYAWFVDVDGQTLIAVTHDVQDADPPPFAARQRILDAMMASVRLVEPDRNGEGEGSPR
ncbi:MAG TPA: hypothetical protein VK936_05475 [Longimicrobiales bacterium]|nr:hypothetical protein [Longimicrobiales bacterium]